MGLSLPFLELSILNTSLCQWLLGQKGGIGEWMTRGKIQRKNSKLTFNMWRTKSKVKSKWQTGRNICNLYHNKVNISAIFKVSINRERKPNRPIEKWTRDTGVHFHLKIGIFFKIIISNVGGTTYMLLVNVYFGNLTTPSNVKKKNTQTLSAINPTFLR